MAVISPQAAQGLPTIGVWRAGDVPPAFSPGELETVVARVRDTVHVVRESATGRIGVATGGQPGAAGQTTGGATCPHLATLPPLYPEWLGDRVFLEVHGLRFPYVAGAMANGIASTRLVVAMARAGMLGFFGAAGLSLKRVETAVDELQQALGDSGLAWGMNLIHSPHEPALESAVADLYIRRGVTRVSAAAYMALTPAIVRYAATGLAADATGAVVRKHHVFAKISRPEVARHFMSPAPRVLLDDLVAKGQLTAGEAALASRVPVAEDLTVESDSGGHTDNQPLCVLFPTLAVLRDQLQQQYGYLRPTRLGAAGGLGAPSGVAAAFQLGAAYVLTGSVNQAAVESGLCPEGKTLLATAEAADVVMAPAADMFELGVKVQVLKRGTMFGARAQQLYELYKTHDSLAAIPADVRGRLEQTVLGASLDEVWGETESFWRGRNQAELDKALRDPKHQMALCFRWYLGKSSRWAIDGEPGRKMDYQIWCGPAMGAFNAWTAGSFLAEPANRGVVQIARNLLEGAAVCTRAQQLRTYGVAVPDTAFRYVPRPLG